MNTTAPLTVADEVTLEITAIAHGGVSIARHGGRVIFVHDTLPGETVRARITEVKKNFARADTVAVLTAAPERVPHIWDAAALERDPQDRAGGAEFGHITLEHQRALKTEVLRDALQRQGKLDSSETASLAVLPLATNTDTNGLGWRTRVRLHVDPDTGVAGPYAARSHRVIPVTELPLACAELQQLAPLDTALPGVETVDLVAPSAADSRSLLKHAGEKQAVGAAEPVAETVFDWLFQVQAGGFWQVHRDAPERLFAEVSGALEALGDSLDPTAGNLDLYGGVGLLTAAFLNAAGDTARITTVEAAAAATDLAAENLADFPGVQALNIRTENYLQDLLKASAPVRARLQRGTVVADPPRSGLGTHVTAQLVELQPANIVYVACDPVAFARDTALLRAGGYDLHEVRGLDMFPHTHHFETIGLFSRG